MAIENYYWDRSRISISFSKLFKYSLIFFSLEYLKKKNKFERLIALISNLEES